jgi:hypothetical protein
MSDSQAHAPPDIVKQAIDLLSSIWYQITPEERDAIIGLLRTAAEPIGRCRNSETGIEIGHD